MKLAKTRRLQKSVLTHRKNYFTPNSIILRALAILVLCLFFTLANHHAWAQIITPDTQQIDARPTSSLNQIIQRPDEDLLIFELHIGQTPILDALLTFEDLNDGSYYVPLMDFMDAIEFPITVNYDAGTAQGWFIDEGNDFKLSLDSAKVIVQGSEKTIERGDVEKHADAIYVSLSALEKWFPITLDVNYSKLAIVLKSLRPLPIELKLQRDQARNNVGGRNVTQRELNPIEKPEAPNFTMPFWDVNLQSRYTNRDTAARTLENRYSVTGRSILLGQDASYSLNDKMNDQQTADIRFKMGRTAFQDETLFAGITQYEIGDVFTQEMPLIADSNAGRGLYFTNTPAYRDFASGSNTITLRGELAVGYQVDIKQNGELLDFIEEPDENGEYIFEDLTVYPGLNVFELVFYGPQGQQRTEEKRVFIPASAVEKGKFEYRFQTIEDNTNLFTDRDDTDPDTSRRRLLAEANYGLSKTSSVRAGYARYSMDGQFKNFSLLGGSTSWKGLRLDLNQAFSQTGHATSGLIETVFKGLRLQAEHKHYNKYISEESDGSSITGDLKHRTDVRASGILPFLFLKTMPITLQASKLTNTQGDEQFEWKLRATKNIQKIRITGELDQTLPPDGNTDTGFNLQISSRLKDISIRGTAQYDIDPEAQLQSLRLTSDIPLNKKTKMRLGISRTGADDPIHNFTLGLNRDIDDAIIGINTSYDDESNFVAMLGASFGLTYDTHKNRTYTSSKRLSDSSALIAEVYNDINADNEKSNDEPYLENVGFKVAGSKKEFHTDENGSVYIPELRSFDRAEVKLDTSTLPNPFMKNTVGDLDYLMRPSQVHTKAYPVILTGEIDGNISIFRPGAKHPASSIDIHIINTATNTVVTSGKSEFDGFFLIPDAPMGQFIAMPSEDQIAQLGYCPVQPQPIRLSEEEPFATVHNEFVLFPNPSEVENNRWLILSKAMNFDQASAKQSNIAQPTKLEPQYQALPTYVKKQSNGKYVIVSGPYQDLAARRVCEAYNQDKKICSDIQIYDCNDLNNLQCVADQLGFLDPAEDSTELRCN